MSKKKTQKAAVAASAPPAPDRWLVYGTVPLRFFLGITFLYAGVQKIADPGFLQPGSSTYIGTQLQAYAVHSPVGPVVQAVGLATPQLTGLLVIAAELVIGALVVAGLATRWAAAAGAAVNFVFLLTASWSVQPYFLGSDSIYAVAWITLALVGDQGILSARSLLFGDSRQDRPMDPDRRRLLLQLGGAAVGVVWVLSILPRTRPGAAANQPPSSPAASPVAGSTPTGTNIGTVAQLQRQGYLNFTDPKTGDPAVAVIEADGVYAFDAVCTHAGCPVNYDPSQRLLVCPCHGATFDPNNGAAVVSGPALTPLPPIRVQEGSDGNVYAG